MVLLNNFIVLTDNRLADPELKIAIQAGRFHLDDGTHFFDVIHDPELDAGHLWQNMPEDEMQRMIRFSMRQPGNNLVPFKSKSARGIISLSIRETSDSEGDMLLRLVAGEKDFFRFRLCLSQARLPKVKGNEDSCIEIILHAIAAWYSHKEKSPGHFKAGKVRLLIDQNFARHLPSRKLLTSFNVEDGKIVFGNTGLHG